MKLNVLFERVPHTVVQGEMETEVSGIQFDSRKVTPGDLFVAQSGTRVDGHEYIGKAVAAGAVAVVCERLPENGLPAGEVVWILAGNSAETLGLLASAWYGYPSSELKVVGVTGTNGKTTTATLLYELVQSLGFSAGLLSTVCNCIGGVRCEATHTTPDALAIHALMRQMADAGCRYCFMEVSSHAIDQRRIAGIDFDGAVFSNITHDHLDYHKTFKAYIAAKKRFFDDLPATAFALTNGDDKNGGVMLQNTAARKFTYAFRRMADFTGKTVERHFGGTLLMVNGKEVWVHFTGDFNGYNLLAVYGTASLLGLDSEEVLTAMSRLVPVAGRFETILSPEGVMAIVDYAHTPDALENVLATLVGLKREGSRVFTVVGAGGDRDRTKRPEMAAAACKYSDKVILTSDNPRSEEPGAIIEEMRKGVPAGKTGDVLAVTDRREAIRAALMMAQPGDLVLIAGKGHETYQEIRGIRYPFDDREVVRESFIIQ